MTSAGEVFYGWCTVGPPGGGGFVTGVGGNLTTFTQTIPASVFVPPDTTSVQIGNVGLEGSDVVVNRGQIVVVGPPIIIQPPITRTRTSGSHVGPPIITVGFERIAIVGIDPPKTQVGVDPTDVALLF